MPNANNESIAKLAYEYWELEGRPAGRAMDHWLKAKSATNGFDVKENSRLTKKMKREKKDQGDTRARRRDLAGGRPQ